MSAAVRCPGVPNPKDCPEIRWSTPGMPVRSSQTFDFPCSGRQEQLRSRFHPNFATTFRNQDNAFFGACKMHFCRCPKIHTAPKTNAFTWARKMHFATLPERMLSSQTMFPKRTDPANAGCGPSFAYRRHLSAPPSANHPSACLEQT